MGVDWSATEIVCAVAGEEGPPERIRRGAKPSLADVRQLVEHALAKVGADELYVMIEAGSPLWVSLLHSAGALVHVADPKQARRFAESQGSSGAKDDPRDAGSLTDMCRSPAHRKAAWAPDSTALQQLEHLGYMHERQTRDVGRVKQRLRDVVRKTMPLVEGALPKDLASKWVGAFLRKVPTAWHARTLTRDALDRLTPGARAASRDRLWDALQQTQAPWLDAVMAGTLATDVQSDLELLALLCKQLAKVEKQMDQVTSSMANRRVAESMGGIAMVLAATLIQYAFRDGVPADRDEASIRMGASPVFIGSGKRKKDNKPKGKVQMRRAAPARARRATYLIGRLASRHLDWARAMYANAMERGQKPATAYRRIARCVLRIQTAMMRTQEPYDNARYVAALKAKGISWANELELAAA
jgi:hypothetical protein